jgi:MHS family shikimate/dehydroshikimate transporter-like MFS transporter
MGVIGAFPLFWVCEGGSLLLIAIAYVWMNNCCASLVVAVQQPLFTEMFDVTSRYSGAGFADQLASALAGGFTPLIAAWLALQNQGRPTYSIRRRARGVVIFFGMAKPVRAPQIGPSRAP